MYEVIEVGADFHKNHFSKLKDNVGLNISNKNSTFCELTAIYNIWKNNIYKKYDYIGFCHYRRYFSGSYYFHNTKILSFNDIKEILNEYDIILPKKRFYPLDTVYSHYEHSHKIEDLNKALKIIKKKYPYLEKCVEKTIYKSHKLYLYNMFVIRTELFNEYCNWIFDILFELEKYIEVYNYDNYQKRVFGFLSERLFNIWLCYVKHSKKIKIYEKKVINIEPEKRVYKIYTYLYRKLLKRKK